MGRWLRISGLSDYIEAGTRLRPRGHRSPKGRGCCGPVQGRKGSSAVAPACLLDAALTAIVVRGLDEDIAYEARVSYLASCGCRSSASEASPPCGMVARLHDNIPAPGAAPIAAHA